MPTTEEQKALKWYISLLELLNEKGVNTISIGSMSRVTALQDLPELEKEIAEIDVSELDKSKPAPEVIHEYERKIILPAFLFAGQNGSYQIPSYVPKELAYVNPMSWLGGNTMIIDGKTLEVAQEGQYPEERKEILRLYKQAQNGQLGLFMGGEVAFDGTYPIVVDENGKAKLLDKSYTEIQRDSVEEKKLTEVETQVAKRLNRLADTSNKVMEIANEFADSEREAQQAYDAFWKNIQLNNRIDIERKPFVEPAKDDMYLQGFYYPYLSAEPSLGEVKLDDNSYMQVKYNVPDGFSEQVCRMITFGAIIDDDNVRDIRVAGNTVRSEEATLAFVRSNFISNVISNPDARMADFGFAIKTGREKAEIAIGQMSENPEKAIRYMQNAIREVTYACAVAIRNKTTFEAVINISFTKEVLKALETEPFKSSNLISEENKRFLELSVKEGEILDAYSKNIRNKEMSAEEARQHEKYGLVAAYFAGRIAKYDPLYAKKYDAEIVESVKQDAKKYNWEEKFEDCESFDEVNSKAMDSFGELDGRLMNFSYDVSNIWDHKLNRIYMQEFPQEGIAQWMLDTPSEEALEQAYAVLENTREFRYGDLDNNPIKYTKLDAIAPFARYELNNKLMEGLVEMQVAAAGELDRNNYFPGMLNSVKDMIQYNMDHKVNDLGEEAAAQYRNKMVETQKMLAGYIEVVNDPNSGISEQDKQIMVHTLDAASRLNTTLQTEIQNFDQQYKGYLRVKNRDFEKEIKWYKEFEELLRENGIDPKNPASLLGIKILGEDEAVPAFLKTNQDGVVSLPSDLSKKEPVDFIYEATMLLDGKKLPDNGKMVSVEKEAKIRQLYEAAKEGKLQIDFIQNQKNPHVVTLDENGKMKLTRKEKEAIAEEIETPTAQGSSLFAKNLVENKKAPKDVVTFRQMLDSIENHYNREPFAFSTKEKANAYAFKMGDAWSEREHYGERMLNLYTGETHERRAEVAHLKDLEREVIAADKRVHNGSPQYEKLMKALHDLVIFSDDNLSDYIDKSDFKQANDYLSTLKDVKTCAQEYLTYRGEPTDKKGIRRVAAVKAVLQYADVKHKGVTQALMTDYKLSDKDIEKTTDFMRKTYDEQDTIRRSWAQGICSAFLKRLEKAGNTKAVTVIRNNVMSFDALLEQTDVVQSMTKMPEKKTQYGGFLAPEVVVTKAISEAFEIMKENAPHNAKYQALMKWIDADKGKVADAKPEQKENAPKTEPPVAGPKGP